MKDERHNKRISDKILKIFYKLPKMFTRKEYMEVGLVSTRTAQRQIHELIQQKKIIISQDLGNKVVYEKIESSALKYQSHFLEDYVPNKTFFLNKSDINLINSYVKIDQSVDLETYTLKIYERLIIDISWASSSLEGNTYTLLETEELILNNKIPFGKTTQDTQMIINHKDAIKFLVQNTTRIEIDEFTVKSVHALLSENLLTSPEAMGALRKIPVGITGTDYQPLSIPQQVEEEFQVLIRKAQLIQNPYEQALFMLVYLPYLQPFEDLNKRTSRLVCNIPFLKSKLIPISFKSIKKDNYLDALKMIYEKNDISFLKKIYLDAIIESAKDYMKIKSVLVQPNELLLKHRLFIKEQVKFAIINCKLPEQTILLKITEGERGIVFDQIINELKHFHEGSIVRFDVSTSDFKKWKSKKIKY